MAGRKLQLPTLTLPADDMEEEATPALPLLPSADDNETLLAGSSEATTTPVKHSTMLEAPSSPPFSPTTPPPPPSSSPLHENDNPGKIPIVKILEVENELRKREATNNDGDLDRVTEHSGDAASNTMSDAAEIANTHHQQGGHTQDSRAVSDSEQETNYQDEEEEEEEWEDFMALYWQQSTSTTTPATAITPITPQQAKSLLAAEDTDLKPCIMEPELDEEPNALSAIRTGCMDIDMDDFNVVHNDNEVTTGLLNTNSLDGMNQLSEMGLECSRAMARVVEKEGSRGKEKMESLRIDLGRMEGRTPKKRGSIKQQNNQPSVLPAVAIATLSQDTFDMHNLTSVLSDDNNSTSTTRDLKQLPPTSTRSFDTRSDAKSTQSMGSETNTSTTGGGGINSTSSSDWKHKISPLPASELIFMTGPILTRTSLRSLVMKKWHASYWMHYGPHGLLIFRSKDHMDDWRYNPYHGKKQRDFLVKLQIDFLKDMELGGGNSKESVLGHRILPVKRKSYGKNEEDMYQFKLERWTNLGCSVLAAFASQEEDEVQILHDTISEILNNCPNNGLMNIDHMLK